MQGLHFIYFVDPMCSWCYGFSPVVRSLRRRYRDVLAIRPVMGGLRPGTTEPMPEKARRTSQDAALDYLAAAHGAFYAEGRDVTSTEVLADIAETQGFDRAAFLTALADEGLKQETWRDYAISQRAGATGFPTLILGPNADGTYALVTRGYQAAEPVMRGVDAWLAGVRAESA